MVLYPYWGPAPPAIAVRPLEIGDAKPGKMTALAITIRGRTDYVFISRSGPRNMVAPAVKLTVEAVIAVIRTQGRRIESVRGDGITGWPEW